MRSPNDEKKSFLITLAFSVILGILFFGPPGTGKTLLAKCIAAQSRATFIAITSSTLVSKWAGDGEKLVKTLFEYARINKPSVIFIDDIDALLRRRNDKDDELTRRMSSEFFTQLDGANNNNKQVLLIGATNMPEDLDEAAKRRFQKLLFIPLPNHDARKQLIKNLLKKKRQ